MKRILLSLNPNEANFDKEHSLCGEVLDNGNGSISIRYLSGVKPAGDGHNLSYDFFGNWSLKDGRGADESFLAGSAGVIVAADRGQQEKAYPGSFPCILF